MIYKILRADRTFEAMEKPALRVDDAGRLPRGYPAATGQRILALARKRLADAETFGVFQGFGLVGILENPAPDPGGGAVVPVKALRFAHLPATGWASGRPEVDDQPFAAGCEAMSL